MALVLCACGDGAADGGDGVGNGGGGSGNGSGGSGSATGGMQAGSGGRDTGGGGGNTAQGSGGSPGGPGGTGGDGDGPPPSGSLEMLPGCAPVTIQTSALPDSLACTGPYTDVAAKQVAVGVRQFAPAYLLWSDGAEKKRWIYLPPGTQIDSSDPDDWRFPVGTRLFKEFSWKGQRVETRVFWKTTSNIWLKATYHWSADETQATRFDGGEVQVGGDTYEIPTAKMCDQCHKGRTDRALGFEPVLLGLPGATGVTLDMLVSEGTLVNYAGPTSLTIGDDGTGMGAAAQGFLHVNCGVSCHNGFAASEAFKTGMRTRLLPDQLDGRSSAGFDAITTMVGVAATTDRWAGWQRITAGNANTSLAHDLITTRDPGSPQDRMPPIGSRIVPPEGSALIRAWIEAL